MAFAGLVYHETHSAARETFTEADFVRQAEDRQFHAQLKKIPSQNAEAVVTIDCPAARAEGHRQLLLAREQDQHFKVRTQETGYGISGLFLAVGFTAAVLGARAHRRLKVLEEKNGAGAQPG